MTKSKQGTPKKRRNSLDLEENYLDEHIMYAQNIPSSLDGATNPPPLLPLMSPKKINKTGSSKGTHTKEKNDT